MSCTNNDFLCYVLNLIASYGVETTALLKWLPWIEERLRENIQGIIGLAGFSFGVWKWWYFRERTLHKRLREYLLHQDERLVRARTYIVEALHRPGAERSFAEPLFAVRALRRVLRRRKWTSLLTIGRIEIGADHLLDKALRQLEGRLETATLQLSGLQRQRASAHELKGAIASARASAQRDLRVATLLDYKSLDSFRAALQVAGYADELRLREYEAHQLSRLGCLSEARARYEALETDFLSGGMKSGAYTSPDEGRRERDLFLARVRTGRAKIIQAQVIASGGSGAAKADALLRLDDGAIALRAPYAPFQDWQGLEQADLQYLTAFVCHNLGFTVREALHLGHAETEYRRILTTTPQAHWFRAGDRRRLRAAAQAGLGRVAAARADAGVGPEYDRAFLLPPLQVLQRPSAKISDDGSHQAIAQAQQ